MSKVTIVFEETEIGLVSVLTEIEGFREDSPAVRLASRVSEFLDSIAAPVAKGPISDTPKLALPHGEVAVEPSRILLS